MLFSLPPIDQAGLLAELSGALGDKFGACLISKSFKSSEKFSNHIAWIVEALAATGKNLLWLDTPAL